jgi:hypothetical protein
MEKGQAEFLLLLMNCRARASFASEATAQIPFPVQYSFLVNGSYSHSHYSDDLLAGHRDPL